MSDRFLWLPEQVYLVDFGSVQAAEQSGTRTVVGTYGYMPPEQFGGQTLPASDLYALGATLIYLASGKSPDQLPQREMRLLFEDRVTLSSRWINWLKWLTEPSLDRRLTSAKQALEALEELSSSTKSAPPLVQPTVSETQALVADPPRGLQCLSGESAQPLVTQPVGSKVQPEPAKNRRKLFYTLGSCLLLGWGGFSLLLRNDSPKSVDDYLTEGNSFYQNQDYDHAIADYNQALRLDPQNAVAYYDRGNAFCSKQDYDRAMADYNQALRLDPKYVDAYINRGNAFYSKQDYDRAMADYNQALKIDPQSVIAYYDRGNVYEVKNSNEAAMADYNQALKIDPDDVDAYTQRGIIFAEKQDYDRAMVNYNQALRLDPKNADAYMNRGKAYLDKGSNEPAMADLNQALEIDPKEVDAYYYRGLAYKGKGSKNEALEDLKKFVNLTDDAKLKQEAQKEILLLRSMR